MFINEYMVNAPGDYVKVFLYGLMYADLAMSLENDMIANELAMEDEDVLKAWSYWEKQNLRLRQATSKAARQSGPCMRRSNR